MNSASVLAAPTSGKPAKGAVDLLRAEVAGRVVVRGSCLAPAIREGDRLDYRGGRRPWPGDLVVFIDLHGRLVVHRFLGYWLFGSGQLRMATAADAATRLDDPAPVADLLGVVSGLVRDGRTIPCRTSAVSRVRAVSRYFALAGRRTVAGLRGRLQVARRRVRSGDDP